jgi:hypothetical protein
MSDEPAHYQRLRSRGNVHIFVICYADRFYDDVPKDVRDKGPWQGSRGEVQNLKPMIRLALARDGYVLIETSAAIFNAEN